MEVPRGNALSSDINCNEADENGGDCKQMKGWREQWKNKTSFFNTEVSVLVFFTIENLWHIAQKKAQNHPKFGQNTSPRKFFELHTSKVFFKGLMTPIRSKAQNNHTYPQLNFRKCSPIPSPLVLCHYLCQGIISSDPDSCSVILKIPLLRDTTKKKIYEKN